MNLQQGTILQGGKYRIERFINSGGFGCTYEATHTMLEERVAIKEFFVKDFCNRDERTARVTVGTQSKKGLVNKLKKKFVDEAKVLYHIQHQGIVRVFDIFEENGTAYFVMDYIDGASLKEIVAREGALPEARAVRYIRQVAEALEFVHSKDRLHLDIKPGNIMVDSQDNAILIDFGASKQYDEVDGENTSTLLGKTPGYAPLEQMGNDVVKFMPATDIYALGATLYKLLTGITPLSATLLASGEELPELPNDISKTTRKAVAVSMNVNKNKRPQTMAEFLAFWKCPIDTTVGKNVQLRNPQLISEEDTEVIDERKNERRVLDEHQSVASLKQTIVQKWWNLYVRDKHSMILFLSILGLMSCVGVLVSIGLLFSLWGSDKTFPWQEYIYGGFLIPISWTLFIGCKQLLALKRNGFWIMAILAALSMYPIPLITKYMYWHSDISLSLSISVVIVVLLALFLIYYLLNIQDKRKGESAWNLMLDSSPWLVKVAIMVWCICLSLFLLPAGL